MKVSFRRIAQSLTGFSTPLFGVSWNPPRFEVNVADDLMTFLEDRRALYNPLEMEEPRHVVASVQQIRQRLTEDLQKIDRDSELANLLRTMRAACRAFMNVGMRYGMGGPVEHGTSGYDVMWLMSALMDLRAVIGTCIGQLCMRYGLDIEEDLASIVPSLQTQTLLELARDDEDQ
jgi:hypothetical protein